MPCDAFGGQAMMTRASHATGTDRLAEVAAHTRLRHRRQRAGRRAAGRAGDDRAGDRAVCERPVAADDVAAIANPRCRGPARPQRREGGRRSRRFRAVFLARAHPLACAIPAARRPLDAWRHIGLYGYRRALPAAVRGHGADRRSNGSSASSSYARSSTASESRCLTTSFEAIGVDTPADLARVDARCMAAGAECRRLTEGLPHSDG